MVHALEKIYRLLKPYGILIDIHPPPDPSSIDVRIGGQAHVAGWLHETDDYGDYEAADKALTTIVARGLFAIERQGTFAFVTHVDTLAELRNYLTEEWENASIDDVTTARIEELMSTPERDKEIILREPVHIARLAPIPETQ
jgi:hypothetical protein